MINNYLQPLTTDKQIFTTIDNQFTTIYNQ